MLLHWHLVDYLWCFCFENNINIRVFLSWETCVTLTVQSNLVISPPVISPPLLLTTSCRRMDFFHVICLINSPPLRLALANWWIDNDLCKLHPISHHFCFVVASLSVPATAPDSVSGTDRACSSRYQSVWTVAHWPSVRLPLPPHYPLLDGHIRWGAFIVDVLML